MKIFLFENVHLMMRAEKLLKIVGISYEVLPTPKQYSAECGMCIALKNELIKVAKDKLLNLNYKIVDDPREVVL